MINNRVPTFMGEGPILALTAAIWHNDQTDQPVKRSLIAYDH
ncbi:hypothetical protein OG900_12690 [Streptomyces sp. NBC_00433]